MRVWLNGIVSDMVRIRQGCVIGWVSTGTYGAHSFPRGKVFFAVPSHYKTFIFKSYNLLQIAHSNPFTSAKAETPRFCLSFPNSCRSQAISWRKGLSMRQLTVSR